VPLSRRTYANYWRLVVISMGFQKVLQGFRSPWPCHLHRVRNLFRHMQYQPELMPTRHFQRAWKAPRPSSRCLSIFLVRVVTYVSHQQVRKLDTALLSSFLTSLIYIYWLFRMHCAHLRVVVHSIALWFWPRILSLPSLQFMRPECPRVIPQGSGGSRQRSIVSLSVSLLRLGLRRQREP
jgi:hypothetical protein